MTTVNDILCSMFAERGLRIKADMALPATDAEIAAHLAAAVIEGNAPTLAEFRAAEIAYTQKMIEARQAALVKQYTDRLERHYDEAAQSRKYDNRLTCALRAGYAGPFQAEGQTFAVWMDTCNALGYQVMAEVAAGMRPLPTEDELIALLPPLVWP